MLWIVEKKLQYTSKQCAYLYLDKERKQFYISYYIFKTIYIACVIKTKLKQRPTQRKMQIYEGAFKVFFSTGKKNIIANGMRYCLFYSFRSQKFNRSLGTAD